MQRSSADREGREVKRDGEQRVERGTRERDRETERERERERRGDYSPRSCSCVSKWDANCPASIYLDARGGAGGQEEGEITTNLQ